MNPNLPETHNIVGSILLQQGKEREALGEFQTALHADPSNFTYANNTAWILGAARDKSLRDGPMAIRLARKAVEQSGGQPAALRTLAAAYAQAGLYQEAIDTCDQAIKGAISQGNTNLAETLRKDRSIYLRNTPLP
jgi:tetratricopeptide (TPR) repeat protein